MSTSVIGLITFVSSLGGALIGMFAARRLPEHHLSDKTKSTIIGSGTVLGTLVAVVIGLIMSTAHDSFASRANKVRELSFQVIRVDRFLRRYGPEADDARAKLRTWAAATTQELFPEPGQTPPSDQTTVGLLEMAQDAILSLNPKDERHNFFRTRAIDLSASLFEARWFLRQQVGHSLPGPFLALLIFWLALIFASLGLFAPPNATAIISLLLGSFALSGALVLILELDNPYSGLVRLSPDSLRQALVQITQ
jgi:hypothetical protein